MRCSNPLVGTRAQTVDLMTPFPSGAEKSWMLPRTSCLARPVDRGVPLALKASHDLTPALLDGLPQLHLKRELGSKVVQGMHAWANGVMKRAISFSTGESFELGPFRYQGKAHEGINNEKRFLDAVKVDGASRCTRQAQWRDVKSCCVGKFRCLCF